VTIEIRLTAESDREAVLTIARGLVEDGTTYAFDRGITDDDLLAYWSPPSSAQGYVAAIASEIAGIFVIKPNHQGGGSHVANASFAVGPQHQGKGVGRSMAESALKFARAAGYTAMQFNIVVSTNHPAISLWESLGFQTIGTTPNGFRMPDGSLTDTLIMHRML